METPPLNIYHFGYGLSFIVLLLLIRVYRNWPKPWNTANDGDFQPAFLALVAKEPRWTMVQKETVSAMLTSWTEQNCGGIILAEKSAITGQPPTKYQMIVFLGPSKFRRLPMVEIQWAYASTVQQARTFLKGEKAEVMELKEETFRALFQHLASYCRTDERIDVAAGCKIYEGFLSPVY